MSCVWKVEGRSGRLLVPESFFISSVSNVSDASRDSTPREGSRQCVIVTDIDQGHYNLIITETRCKSNIETRDQKINGTENKSCLEEFQYTARHQCSRGEWRLLREFPEASFQMHAVQYEHIVKSFKKLKSDKGVHRYTKPSILSPSLYQHNNRKIQKWFLCQDYITFTEYSNTPSSIAVDFAPAANLPEQ